MFLTVAPLETPSPLKLAVESTRAFATTQDLGVVPVPTQRVALQVGWGVKVVGDGGVLGVA